MSVKTVYRAFFLPEWRGSVLKKRAAAWFIMRSWGLGIFPNKRPDGSNWPKGPCLPLALALSTWKAKKQV